MNKIKRYLFIIVGLVILTACSGNSSKYESVTYENSGMPGLKSTVVFDYDEDRNIQKVVTTSEFIYTETQMTKDELQKNYDKSIAETKDIKGMERTAEFSDEKMTEIATIVVKDVPKKDLNYAFPAMVKDDNVSLDTYINILKQSGYTKK